MVTALVAIGVVWYCVPALTGRNGKLGLHDANGFGGFCYDGTEVWISVDIGGAHRKVISGDNPPLDFRIVGGKHCIVIDDGMLSIDGRDYVEVKSGDKVWISPGPLVTIDAGGHAAE
jgi:hypothetical protein